MAIQIPRVGDILTVESNTKARLIYTSQNKRFIEKTKEKHFDKTPIKDGENYEILLTIGTKLTVDRVYVRGGTSSSYDSITLKVKNDGYLPNGRFFLTIDDANNLNLVKYEKPKDEKCVMNLESYIAKEEPCTERPAFYTNRLYLAKKKRLVSVDIDINIYEAIKKVHEFVDDELGRVLGISLKEAISKLVQLHESKKIKLTKNTANKLVFFNLDSTLSKYEKNPLIKTATVELQKIESERNDIDISDPFILAIKTYEDKAGFADSALEHLSTLCMIYTTIKSHELNGNDKQHSSRASHRLYLLEDLISNKRTPFSIMYDLNKGFHPGREDFEIKEMTDEPEPTVYFPYKNYRYIDLIAEKGLPAKSYFCIKMSIDDQQVTASELRKAITKSKKNDAGNSSNKPKTNHLILVE